MAQPTKPGWYARWMFGEVIDEEEPPRRAGFARVFLHNDDKSPMEFVVIVLMEVFGMEKQAAARQMLRVHYRGQASCGDFSNEDAEAKVAEVLARARRAGHPLQCTMEKE